MLAILRAVLTKTQHSLKALASRQDARKETSIDTPLLRIEIARAVNDLALPGELQAVAESVVKWNGVQMKRLLGIDPRMVPGLGTQVKIFRDQNLLLIRSLADQQVSELEKILEDPATANLRTEELVKLLVKRFEIPRQRAELIAVDQVLKLNGKVTGYRQQAAGISKYMWTTSMDERVRPTHQELEGKVFRWDAPPPPGHPGEDYRCRCTAFPLLEELDEFD
jgi:SPP1 gp7 family putative phage head morphogenesis protein